MIKKSIFDVDREKITIANTKNTTVRWLITKDDGSKHSAMRRFEIQPGGGGEVHQHPEDHLIYILNGEAEFFNNDGIKFKAGKDNVIYIPPNEPHGIRNINEESFIFICIIPYLK
ncbi:MAG: cupin domain-containing protein [Promethearchaeota archaeon]